jgi:hypothetical protein
MMLSTATATCRKTFVTVPCCSKERRCQREAEQQQQHDGYGSSQCFHWSTAPVLLANRSMQRWLSILSANSVGCRISL